MARIRLQYVDEFRDRHGTVRRYFRRNGRRIPLPGHPGSKEFNDAYAAALSATEPPKRDVKAKGGPGTFDRLASEYYKSIKFLKLGPDTKRAYRGVIDRLMALIGKRLVAQMTPDHVDRLMAKFADRPGAGTEALKKLRILITLAQRKQWITADPTIGAERFASGEFHTWTEDELTLFEKRWPIGSRERTAYALHLYTGQRRSDVVTMGWPDVSSGGVNVVQAKTGEKLWLPIHPRLAEALAAWRKEHVTILYTGQGKPFRPAGYGNWFRDACRAAGLPDQCGSHGLRKAAGRRMAEAGASTNQIAAVLGHRSLSEVERYTRGAEQKRLATAGIALMPGQNEGGQCQPENKDSANPSVNTTT